MKNLGTKLPLSPAHDEIEEFSSPNHWMRLIRGQLLNLLLLLP